MLINCFCAADGGSNDDAHHKGPPGVDQSQPVAPRPRPVNNLTRAKTSRMRRQGSDGSRVSSTSNESISRLPARDRTSDAKIEAMMMPLPHEPRPSRCLRLSHPKTYSALVSDMKASKGCRDWRNFAVFYADDVDMSMSADDAARKRARDYQRKLRQLNCSFSGSDTATDSSSISVDMIG